ncbi:hypothetical protein R3P38DRAFT_2761175 [Favolaschia claudopus]|uniref:Uncharacterized protein n=1 Tax=Favolaschia claudopus TaxID=2862362 RepID=A0AAW0DYH2_9AGAR
MHTDGETQKEHDFQHSSKPRPTSGLKSAGSNTFFPNSRQFTICGGTFNNYTKPAPRAAHNDFNFRRIPFGDLYLHHEIHENDSSRLVLSSQPRNMVRRLYSAKVSGGESKFTAAIYQGGSAEAEWRHDVSQYMTVRCGLSRFSERHGPSSKYSHPNILQIYGTARSKHLWATVFHDDLVPYRDFLSLYHRSPVLTVYIRGYLNTEFLLSFVRQLKFISTKLSTATFWLVNRSTGHLCTDLSSSNSWNIGIDLDSVSFLPEISVLDFPKYEKNIMDAMKLNEYYDICYLLLGTFRTGNISILKAVNLGSIISVSTSQRLDELVKIASFEPDWEYDFNAGGWCVGIGEPLGCITGSGWTWYELQHPLSVSSAEADGALISLEFSVSRQYAAAWFSKANHIFKQQNISSNFDDYALIYHVLFEVTISASESETSPGFLFLCPPEALRNGKSSFRWPEFPAYWSLDSSGSTPLCMREAEELGFPSIELETRIYSRSWDESVYIGLRRFHQAKGFDPDSAEVAQHLDLQAKSEMATQREI